MLNAFLASLSPMLMLFCCLAIGFVLKKTKFLPENSATVLSKLETHVLIPCINIGSMMKYCTPATLAENYSIVLFGLLASALSVLLAYLLAPLFSKHGSDKKIYRYSLAIANYGFMGNAIVPAILGEKALFFYLLFTLPLNVVLFGYVINWLLPEKKEHKSFISNFLNPSIISIVAGIVLGLIGAGSFLPAFVTNTVTNLSSCMGPVAMILTGFVIGGYKISAMLTNVKVYITSLLRLTLLPAVILGVLWLCGADKMTLLLAFFAFGTPLGLNTVVFPAAYGGDTSLGASMAMVSHVLGVVSMPLMYALASTLF